jgi:hypothetical protein
MKHDRELSWLDAHPWDQRTEPLTVDPTSTITELNVLLASAQLYEPYAHETFAPELVTSENERYARAEAEETAVVVTTCDTVVVRFGRQDS